MGPPRHLRHRHAAIGHAAHPHHAVGQQQVGRARLEQLARRRQQRAAHRRRRRVRRAALRDGAAAREGAGAGRRLVGVGLPHRHRLERHAELVGDELGGGGGVPLPLRRERHEAGHAAVGLHAHRRGLRARHVRHAAPAIGLGSDAGVLGVARHPDAEQPPPRAARLALAHEPLVAGQGERGLERLGEIAAVVDEAGRGGERVRVARDQVALPHEGRVEPEPVREQIERALHHEGAHGHAHPAVGAERRLVRGERDDLEGVGRRAVGARQDGGGAERLERPGQRIDVVGAHVRHEPRPQAAQRAVGVRGGLDLHALLAGVGRRGQVLAPGLDPLHRPPRAPGQRGHRQVLGHHVHLLAEAAAGVRHDDPHAGLGKAEGAGHAGAEDVGHLGAGPERQRRRLPSGR